MKILQITSTFLPVLGGQEKVVEELSSGLKKLGHEVTILTTNLLCENKNLPKEENYEGIKIVRCKNDLYLGSYGYSKEAIKWLKKNWRDYDIIHSHGYNRFLSEFSVHYLKNKKPVLFTPHGFIHTKKNYLFKIIHDLFLGRWIDSAKLCTALTRLDFKEYKRLGIKKEKIIEIPNGVNIENFKGINKKEIEEFIDKYKLKKKTILYVGRIHQSKGLRYLVETIKNLNVQLFIVGKDAGYKRKLMEIIEKKDVKEKVIFSGPLKKRELSKAYLSSDIFILFSEWEGFGITVIEAMAAGKPIIVSDRGSLPFLVENNINGFIVPFKNTSILKEKINTLIKEKGLEKRFREENKIKAKKYEWEKIIKKYEKTYKDIK